MGIGLKVQRYDFSILIMGVLQKMANVVRKNVASERHYTRSAAITF